MVDSDPSTDAAVDGGPTHDIADPTFDGAVVDETSDDAVVEKPVPDVDDGLVFCERCRRRVPPEVRQTHVHGERSGRVQEMTEGQLDELDRARAPRPWWSVEW